MGDFRIKIEAVGGHGCDRKAKAGEHLAALCGRHGCVDCDVAAFVRALRLSGVNVKVAELTHWPADLPGYSAGGEVKDDILGMKRISGDFGPKNF